MTTATMHKISANKTLRAWLLRMAMLGGLFGLFGFAVRHTDAHVLAHLFWSAILLLILLPALARPFSRRGWSDSGLLLLVIAVPIVSFAAFVVLFCRIDF